MDFVDVVLVAFALGVVLCWVGQAAMNTRDQEGVAALGVIGVVAIAAGAVCIGAAVVLVTWEVVAFVGDAAACLDQFKFPLCSQAVLAR